MNNTQILKSISFKFDDDQKLTENDRDILIEKLKELKEKKDKLLPKNKLLLSFISAYYETLGYSDAFAKLNEFRLEDEVEENKKLIEALQNLKLSKIMQQNLMKEEIEAQNVEKATLIEKMGEIKKELLDSTTEFLQSIEYPHIKTKLNKLRKVFKIHKEFSKIRLENLKSQHALKMMKLREKEVENIGEKLTLTDHGKLTSEAQMLEYKKDVVVMNLDKAIKSLHRSNKNVKKNEIARVKIENVHKNFHEILIAKEAEIAAFQETKNRLKSQIILLQMKKEKLMNQSGLNYHQNMLHHFDNLKEKLVENKKLISELEFDNQNIMNKIMQK
ncbi:hypothetical protein PVAND_010765 [Polypedilum vanderplanki]|uniref:DUF4201 domain-containing protein n=1 Tax=Polypedilum vanderplanki TaxID=319348 RepID=A0A9J6CGZ3_POLVA|nr:hypothetical protein PVAND_010765 [Polypedilum vanderplanki]